MMNKHKRKFLLRISSLTYFVKLFFGQGNFLWCKIKYVFKAKNITNEITKKKKFFFYVNDEN